MSPQRADAALALGLRAVGVLAAIIVVGVVAFICWEAAPAFTDIGPSRFLTDPSWHPNADRFGMGPMILGTLLIVAGAVLVATPLGVLSGVYCAWQAPPRLARLHRRLIGLLAGTPSVVFGFWGLVVLVPLIARFEPPGASLLAGVLIVALMILPTIALMADAAIAAVPAEYVRGAAALGLDRPTTLRRVVLPTARRGIGTGVILATARAIGETMAVLMVCGNVVQVPDSVFDPIRALTANIALEMAYAMDAHRSALFVSGLLLMGVVSLLVIAAQVLGRRRLHA